MKRKILCITVGTAVLAMVGVASVLCQTEPLSWSVLAGSAVAVTVLALGNLVLTALG